MKKVILIILGVLLACLVGACSLFLLVNFPFILMHSETRISKEDKAMIRQYAADTFGEEPELVRFDRYSNTGGTGEKFAVYKVDGREFEVGMRWSHSDEEWQFYDTFVSEYILGDDDGLNKQIPLELHEADPNSYIGFDLRLQDMEEYNAACERLSSYKKEIHNFTREDILSREKDSMEVYFRAELSPKSDPADYEDAIYELYKVMRSTGMGEIDIVICFGVGNYQTAGFEFQESCDYPVNGPEDLKDFYK